MVQSFKEGDRIKNVGPQYDESGTHQPNAGKTGTIRQVTMGGSIHVKYDDGSDGCCREGGKNYKKINSITIMQKLSNFITKALDADTQALLKAGYIDQNLEPTEKSFDKIDEIQYFANRAALVTAANEEIAAAAAKCEKLG